MGIPQRAELDAKPMESNPTLCGEILGRVEGRVNKPGLNMPRRKLLTPTGSSAGSNAGEPADDHSTGASDREAAAASRFGSSLGSRAAKRSRRICGRVGEVRDGSEHEPSGQSV